MQQDMIPVFSNSVGAEELHALEDVFQSRWLGKGKQCAALEDELAKALGARQFLLTNSGTSAIFIAIGLLDLQPGDEVIISSVNFVACANAVMAAGAVPVFADVDPHTLNTTAQDISRVKTERTRAVIVLHYGGHPCDLDGIRTACGDEITLIEDAAIAFPSTYRGQSCGTVGDIGIFSFDAVKALSMGDGGGLVIRDAALWDKAVALRYHGLGAGASSGLSALNNRGADRWWEFTVEAFAGRHVSNDIAAAIGRVQLKKLPGFVARRREIWRMYQDALSGIEGLRTPPEPRSDCTSSNFLYWIQTPEKRDGLAVHLSKHGVYCTFRYYPLHLVEAYGPQQPLAGAEEASETTLNLPLHQNLSDADVDKIAQLVRTYMETGS